MAPQYLCVAVLLLATTHAASETLNCATYHSQVKDTHRCATAGLLRGWLNVVNRTAMRFSEVLRNATEIKNSAGAALKKANEALEGAKKVLSKLEKGSKEAVAVQNVIVDVNNAVKRMKESEANADSVKSAADDSERLKTDGFGSISRAAGFFVGYTYTEWQYDLLRDKIDRILTKNSNKAVCVLVRNVSSELSAYAEQLNNSTLNLTAWKNKMLELLKTTYDELQNNSSTCVGILKNSPEKLNDLKWAVGNASDKLIVAVEKFEVARLAIEAVEANIAKAEDNVKNVTTTAHDSLKRNGTVLCGILQQHTVVWKKVRQSKRRLEEVNQKVAKAATQAQAMQVGTGSTSARVHEVVEKLTTVVKLYGAVGDELSSNAANAKQSISSADEKSKHAVEELAQVNSKVQLAGEILDEKLRKLNNIMRRITESLEKAKVNVNTVNLNDCSDDLSALLISSWGKNGHSAIKLDVSELQAESMALNGLQTENEETNDKIESTNVGVHEVLESIKYATNFEKEAVAAASNAVIEALSKMMSQLCAASAGLRDLRSKSAALSQRAAALKASVSDEKLRAAAVLVDASGPKELPAHVEDAFAIASRRAAVAEKLLQSSDAKRGNANTKLGAGMRKSGSEGQGSTIHGRIDELVRNISSGISSNASPDVCETTYITKFMQSLKRSDDELILPHGALVITELAQFTVGINSGVKNARRQMERATASAGEAEAALAEAMRVAREGSAQRHCTPLHRQLLSVLRRMW
ncbi:hypothetical protein ERJ75_000542400 [Trypanosoma vivax]|nr:hypothetical protein ERJ75_000542400 [Trypanosoma vivax]